jgi:hypothetical protein
MDIPPGVNLERSLFNESLHSKWEPTGGNDGSVNLSSPPATDPPIMPDGLIYSAEWKHASNNELRLSVMFQGLDNPEPEYTILVYDGQNKINGDQIDRIPDVHATDIVTETKYVMKKYRDEESLRDKLHPRRLKKLFE